jgi:hypothetical protein
MAFQISAWRTEILPLIGRKAYIGKISYAQLPAKHAPRLTPACIILLNFLVFRLAMMRVLSSQIIAHER